MGNERNAIRLLEWFQPLLSLIWSELEIVGGGIRLGHCPLNIVPDILRILLLICDHSVTRDSIPDPKCEPCWEFFMTLESYLTELDARVMSEFLDCLGLTVAEVKPIFPVKQFLGQIMSDLYLKYDDPGRK